MKIISLLSTILLALSLSFITSCSNSDAEFKKDVDSLADVYCRILEVSNNLLLAQTKQQTDNKTIETLMEKKKQLEEEQAKLNAEFRNKYEKRFKDPQFMKKVSNGINESMLNCKFLSKEDKEQYQKEISK